MQLRRFYSPELTGEEEIVTLPDSESQHALRVLRLQPGEPMLLLNGKGLVARAELLPPPEPQRRNRQAQCRILEARLLPRPEPPLTLYVAPPRGKAFDLVLKAATELGVAAIQPILCRYGVARPETTSENARETLVAAVKQSENPYIPQLLDIQPFSDILKKVAKSGEGGLFGASPAAEATPRQVRDTAFFRSLHAIWVGPEGGFAPEEEAALLENGMLAVTIGSCILRVETAVPALLGYWHGRCDALPAGGCAN